MRLKIVAALCAVLALGGCTNFKIAGLDLSTIEQGISLASKSAANPITKDDLAKAELAADTVVKALRLYKQACAQGSVDTNCRSNVAAIQAYTRQIPPYRDQLRSFVKNNDQINAHVVFNQLTALIANVKTTATTLGVNIGAQ
jgi:hypothetical protein